MSVSGLTNIFSSPKRKPFPFPDPNIKSNANSEHDFRVCAKTNHFEVNLTRPGSNVKHYGQFSAQVMPNSPNESKQDDDRKDYHLNTGYAIRSLREDFPKLFYRELNFDIYRDDIVFKDPLNKFVGIENYKSIFWALRFHGRIFFKASLIEMVSLWQPKEGVIIVRWTIHGAPRVPWEMRVRFDGISEYKLDKDGRIYEHKVDNIAISSPLKPLRASGMEQLIEALSCPSTPKPTCFEIQSSSASRFITFSGKDQDADG